MAEWNDIRAVVNRIERRDPSWVSQRQSLLKIIDRAESADIEPIGVPTISNLSTIITEAKRACRRKNYGDLRDLFRKAATMTNQDLRLALCVSEIETIPVARDEDQYVVKLNEEQYERVRRSTRAHHVYRIRPELLATP